MDDITLNASKRLASLVSWYREMGVGDFVDDVPVDWLTRNDNGPGAHFKAPVTLGSPNPSLRPVSMTGSGTASGSSTPASAPQSRSALPTAPRRPLAQAPLQAPSPRGPSPGAGVVEHVNAASLNELRKQLEAFEGCGLSATAKNLCFYRGNPSARLMIVGEAPGPDEDRSGEPFVGPPGELLDLILAAIGLSSSDVHLTNLVYWRPPGNRKPSAREIAACAPFLRRQIDLVSPRALLVLGDTAARTLLRAEDGIMKTRGKWLEVNGEAGVIPARATLDPAYVLRVPASKRQVWQDFLEVKARL